MERGPEYRKLGHLNRGELDVLKVTLHAQADEVKQCLADEREWDRRQLILDVEREVALRDAVIEKAMKASARGAFEPEPDERPVAHH